jgi:hypothetical protein
VKRGSALLYSGKIWRGGGASCPHEMLRLIGYQLGARTKMGYYRDVEDPIIPVRRDGPSTKPRHHGDQPTAPRP